MRAPDAPLGGGDPTRRHAVRADGRALMPGLTRPEAEDAREWLAVVPAPDRPLALAEVALPVLLTDGAGPHLLGADGALVLVLGPHPWLQGARVAMGAPSPRHAVGAQAIGHVVRAAEPVGAVDMPLPNDFMHVLVRDVVDAAKRHPHGRLPLVQRLVAGRAAWAGRAREALARGSERCARMTLTISTWAAIRPGLGCGNWSRMAAFKAGRAWKGTEG